MILALVVQVCLATHAQVKARVEIPWKEDGHSYLVIPMGEEGMMLATISEKSSDGRRTLRLSHYDTDLRLVKSDSTQLDRSLDFEEYLYDEGRCLVVLREMGRVLLGPRKVIGDDIAIVTSSMIEQAQEAAESETVKRIKPIWAGGDSLLAMYQSRFPT